MKWNFKVPDARDGKIITQPYTHTESCNCTTADSVISKTNSHINFIGQKIHHHGSTKFRTHCQQVIIDSNGNNKEQWKKYNNIKNFKTSCNQAPSFFFLGYWGTIISHKHERFKKKILLTIESKQVMSQKKMNSS